MFLKFQGRLHPPSAPSPWLRHCGLPIFFDPVPTGHRRVFPHLETDGGALFPSRKHVKDPKLPGSFCRAVRANRVRREQMRPRREFARTQSRN
jgi:hypothetical protein